MDHIETTLQNSHFLCVYTMYKSVVIKYSDASSFLELSSRPIYVIYKIEDHGIYAIYTADIETMTYRNNIIS